MEVSCQYENLGKSLDYVLTASGRARSGKEVSCKYENLAKPLDYVPTAFGRHKVREGGQLPV
jgi:hypothetical protein